MFKTNEYFEGKVVSIAFKSEKGPATAGVMAAGDYEFGTSSREYMTITTGSLQAKLPGSNEWTTYGPYDTFIVEANQKFQVKLAADTSYICVYE